MTFLKSHGWCSGHYWLYYYYYDLFLLTTLLTPNVWVCHTKQLPADTSWVSCNSIQFWHYLELAQVKGSVPQGCSPLEIPVVSSGFPGYPHFCLMATNQWFLWPSPQFLFLFFKLPFTFYIFLNLLLLFFWLHWSSFLHAGFFFYL